MEKEVKTIEIQQTLPFCPRMEENNNKIATIEESKIPSDGPIDKDELQEKEDESTDATYTKIITKEDKNGNKKTASSKRSNYKRALKRSSATDDIDSLTGSNELAKKV